MLGCHGVRTESVFTRYDGYERCFLIMRDRMDRQEKNGVFGRFRQWRC